MHISSKITIPFINTILFTRSLFWKRDPSIVLFGSWFGEKFADNSRYLFQYLSEHKNELGLTHVVWVTSNPDVFESVKAMGYEVYMMNSKESISYHKKAKYHIICNSQKKQVRKDNNGKKHYLDGDILDIYSYGAIRINLWHGLGVLKACALRTNSYINRKKSHPHLYSFYEFLLKHSRIYNLFFKELGGWGRHYRIAPSHAEIENICSDYGCPESLCILTNYPRNAQIPHLLPNEEKILDKMTKYKAIILWLPTFRTNPTYHQEDLSVCFKSFLIENCILWIEKPHTASFPDSESETSPNVIRLPHEFDINVLLPYVSVLITDYSSVFMDIMYHNRPVVFYIPDFENYKKGHNGFANDPEMFMCGPKCYTTSQLQEAVKKSLLHPEDAKSPNYEYVRDLYWSTRKDLSGIWQDILSSTHE